MDIMLTMADSKKKTKAKIIVKYIYRILRIDDKKPKEHETDKKEVKNNAPVPVISPARSFRERIEKLELKENEKENNHFSVEVIDKEENTSSEKLKTQLSDDSGFAEKEKSTNDVTEIFLNLKISDENEANKQEKAKDTCEDVAESFSKLKLGDAKEKKLRTVTVSRGPVGHKSFTSRTQTQPYPKHPSQVTINKHTFSGGQVIEVDESQEIVQVQTALYSLQSSSMKHDNVLDNEENFNIITDFIRNDQSQNTIPVQCQEDVTFENWNSKGYENISMYNDMESNFILDEFGIQPPPPGIVQSTPSNIYSNPSVIEQLLDNNCQPADTVVCSKDIMSIFDDMHQSVYMTPPRSVNMASPLSDFQPSPRAHTSSSDYTFSPDRSSPVFNSDMETYQKIEGQVPVTAEIETAEKKTNLKQFKSMQKEIAAGFASKECCQKNRKTCKEIFKERFDKFNAEERRNICLNVCRQDLNAVLCTLKTVLLSISKGSDKEDLEYVIFSLVCERVMAERPTWFLGEFGLTLLELGTYRCRHHPTLIRYLVECVHAVDSRQHHDPQTCIFQGRMDSRRDDLLIGCARGGDAFADALYWLVWHEPHQRPLFDVGHVNTEGYSALHVACKAHSVDNSRLHITHVLLEHSKFDLEKGEMKGGDTALHLAVSSPTCDLRLVLLIFSHVDCKEWKRLAHYNNLGSVSPIEYARCAVRSSTRQNFPKEVLEFMKKLR